MKKFAAILLSLVLTLTVALADSIYVVSREDGSGTRAAFIELTGVEQKDADGNKVDMTTVEAAVYSGTSEVKTTVSQDVAAIGYISLGSMDASVKALKVARNPEDGAEAVYVEATPENVASGDYAIARPFNIAYKADNLSATAQDFINWILSAEGQAIVTAQKYVAKEPAEYQAAPVAGKIVVGGSSSVSPLMEKLIEAYKTVNPNAELELQTTDSTTGVSGALEGTYTIGMASRELKDSEVEGGAKATVLALDGIAVVVNPSNTTDDLTVDQIKGIYTGELTTWADVQ